MLSVSHEYASATTDADRFLFAGAGQTMLVIISGKSNRLYRQC
jgi:hypothetical protein